MNPCKVTIHAQGKKKKTENAESKNADAHPKHTLYVINKRDTLGVTSKELHLL